MVCHFDLFGCFIRDFGRSIQVTWKKLVGGENGTYTPVN